MAPEPRPLVSTRLVKEPTLPLDEDQFDIPTFLRRQGQGELP
jgi:cell division protein FtsZ